MKSKLGTLLSLILAVVLTACQQGVTPGSSISVADSRSVSTGTTGLAIGADVSEIPYAQTKGVAYSETTGTSGDGMQILYNHGYKWARIRVNVEPTSSDYAMFTNLAYAVSSGKKAKSLGFKLLIDFQYSYWWADPSNQWTPDGSKSSANWSTTDISTLDTQVYNYTKSAMQSLVNGGATPDMVQIGNEITNGLLWPLGGPYQTGGSWKNMAWIINSGINAVKAVNSGTQIMIHLDSSAAASWSTTSNWISNFSNNSGQWSSVDAIGLSFYPQWSGGTSALSNLSAVLSNLKSSYSGKQVWIAETAWFYSGTTGSSDPYPRTPAGQYNFLRALIGVLQNYSNVKGVYYWGTGWSRPSLWAGSAASWSDDPPRALFDTNAKATTGIDGL
jgi:arabinogalactan endo-1,4-beta-galactosidase